MTLMTVSVLPKNSFTACAMHGGRASQELEAGLKIDESTLTGLGISPSDVVACDMFSPQADGGNWKKYRMAGGDNGTQTAFWLDEGFPDDLTAVAKKTGVAFRLHLYSGADVWAQEPGNNTPVKESRP